MADQIAAEEGALNKGARAVADARIAIDKSRGDVRSDVASTTTWTGAAADDFHRLMESWDTKAGNLMTVLDNLEIALGGTEKEMAAGEDSNASDIGRLKSAMHGI